MLHYTMLKRILSVAVIGSVLTASNATSEATSEEAVDIFDRVARAEGTGFPVTKKDGALPPDTVTRADFSRSLGWCATPADDDNECETQFKAALFLYGKALPITGGFLCDDMTRKECMDVGRSEGYFPDNIMPDLAKGDDAVRKKHEEVDHDLENHARSLRGRRHHKSNERIRGAGP